MAWVTPKINWTPVDGIAGADLNRIEGNHNAIRFGGGDLGSNVASANNLAISKTYHVVTGNTDIKFLATTPYLSEARVVLRFDSAINLLHDSVSPPTGYAPLFLTDISGDHQSVTMSDANRIVEFIFDGVYWRNINLLVF